MVNFTIKGIPDDLYEALRERADQNRRSINSELLVCLEEALRGTRVSPEEMLARVDAVRERIRVPPYTESSLNAAKNRGRRR